MWYVKKIVYLQHIPNLRCISWCRERHFRSSFSEDSFAPILGEPSGWGRGLSKGMTYERRLLDALFLTHRESHKLPTSKS
jgi:hypothetical protein